jgi:hypothetical protein
MKNRNYKELVVFEISAWGDFKIMDKIRRVGRVVLFFLALIGWLSIGNWLWGLAGTRYYSDVFHITVLYRLFIMVLMGFVAYLAIIGSDD